MRHMKKLLKNGRTYLCSKNHGAFKMMKNHVQSGQKSKRSGA
jgi:hypothetical protein